MKLKFNVADKGQSYEVISVNQNESDFASCLTYEVYSWEVYEKIATALLEGKKVRIPKDIEKELDVNDVIIEEQDELETLKSIISLKMKDSIYTAKINKALMIDIYNYILLNTWFSDKGIYITEENQEAKYLEIINKVSEIEDSTLANKYIENLETMLNSKDRIANANETYSMLIKYLSKVEDAADETEVNTIYNEFLSDFKR
jgi:hypothetical protein